MKEYSTPKVELFNPFGSDIVTDIIIASNMHGGDNDTPLLGAMPDQTEISDKKQNH